MRDGAPVVELYRTRLPALADVAVTPGAFTPHTSIAFSCDGRLLFSVQYQVPRPAPPCSKPRVCNISHDGCTMTCTASCACADRVPETRSGLDQRTPRPEVGRAALLPTGTALGRAAPPAWPCGSGATGSTCCRSWIARRSAASGVSPTRIRRPRRSRGIGRVAFTWRQDACRAALSWQPSIRSRGGSISLTP